jgi:hypothetical protein
MMTILTAGHTPLFISFGPCSISLGVGSGFHFGYLGAPENTVFDNVMYFLATVGVVVEINAIGSYYYNYKPQVSEPRDVHVVTDEELPEFIMAENRRSGTQFKARDLRRMKAEARERAERLIEVRQARREVDLERILTSAQVRVQAQAQARQAIGPPQAQVQTAANLAKEQARLSADSKYLPEPGPGETRYGVDRNRITGEIVAMPRCELPKGMPEQIDMSVYGETPSSFVSRDSFRAGDSPWIRPFGSAYIAISSEFRFFNNPP